MKDLQIKVQTRRTTKQVYNVLNFNVSYKSYEMGLVTSKYWGDFEDREEPLVQFQIDGIPYEIPLNDFKKLIKKAIKKRRVQE